MTPVRLEPAGQLLSAEGNRGPRSGGFNSHNVSGQLLLAEGNRGKMIFHMLVSLTMKSEQLHSYILEEFSF